MLGGGPLRKITNLGFHDHFSFIFSHCISDVTNQNTKLTSSEGQEYLPPLNYFATDCKLVHHNTTKHNLGKSLKSCWWAQACWLLLYQRCAVLLILWSLFVVSLSRNDSPNLQIPKIGERNKQGFSPFLASTVYIFSWSLKQSETGLLKHAIWLVSHICSIAASIISK